MEQLKENINRMMGTEIVELPRKIIQHVSRVLLTLRSAYQYEYDTNMYE